MKTTAEILEKRESLIRIKSSLNKYDNVVLFPEKLAKANEQLKKSGFPAINK